MERSQSERQVPYDITYRWNLKYGTNDPTYKTERDHGYGEQMCGCQGGGGWGARWGGLGVWRQQMQTITFGVDKQ